MSCQVRALAIGSPGRAIPQHRRLALIRDASADIVAVAPPDRARGDHLLAAEPQLLGIVLHPAGLRHELLMLALLDGHHPPGAIKQDASRAGGADRALPQNEPRGHPTPRAGEGQSGVLVAKRSLPDRNSTRKPQRAGGRRRPFWVAKRSLTTATPPRTRARPASTDLCRQPSRSATQYDTERSQGGGGALERRPPLAEHRRIGELALGTRGDGGRDLLGRVARRSRRRSRWIRRQRGGRSTRRRPCSAWRRSR